MFVNRRYTEFLNPEDDFAINIKPFINKSEEAVPVVIEDDILVGWRIQPRYE